MTSTSLAQSSEQLLVERQRRRRADHGRHLNHLNMYIYGDRLGPSANLTVTSPLSNLRQRLHP